jgi:hypothetical protein
VGEYLLERPLRSYFDPYVLMGFCALALLMAIGAPALLVVALLVLLALRLSRPVWRLCRDVREDYLLLRHGVVVNAHVLGVRPCRDSAGRQAGAYLDCAIPITRKRTSVGSVWMPDAADALRVSSAGRLPVICLARAPGAWRLRDGDGPHLRYEPARQ